MNTDTTYSTTAAGHPVVCSWCEAIISYGSVANSHGICEPCATAALRAAKAGR